VDFDPVHARAAGQQPEGMDTGTAALFPDSFEKTPLGEVPCGWRTVRLEDVTERITKGTTPTQSQIESLARFVFLVRCHGDKTRSGHTRYNIHSWCLLPDLMPGAV
jgi:hypothetical protein